MRLTSPEPILEGPDGAGGVPKGLRTLKVWDERKVVMVR